MILGISFDNVEDNRAFAVKFDFPFKLLCDTDHRIGEAYGAAEPGKNTPRRIAYLIGPDGRIEKVWDKVDPKSHPNEVLAAVS